MTQFERLLKNAQTGEEILNMQSCMADNLTEDEIIKLKADYLGMDENSVRNMLKNIDAVKAKKWGKTIQNGMQSVINCIL